MSGMTGYTDREEYDTLKEAAESMRLFAVMAHGDEAREHWEHRARVLAEMAACYTFHTTEAPSAA